MTSPTLPLEIQEEIHQYRPIWFRRMDSAKNSIDQLINMLKNETGALQYGHTDFERIGEWCIKYLIMTDEEKEAIKDNIGTFDSPSNCMSGKCYNCIYYGGPCSNCVAYGMINEKLDCLWKTDDTYYRSIIKEVNDYIESQK